MTHPTVQNSAQSPPPAISQRAFDVVAIAASAGGIKAISTVLRGLPSDFPVAVVIVQHLAPQARSLLVDILARVTQLQVKQAVTGDCLTAGWVYIAPPNYHLLVTADGTLALTQSALVHFVRPSADLLFESVATSYGQRAIAVVLSGTGIDGGLGVEAIKAKGGTVIAQNQASSAFFGMPHTAIETGQVDFVLPLNEIAPTLLSLVLKENH
ncbi:MAG: chemotaxis protein CheB [Cyanobacteria bacterium]|nr:chemotaxis protein CheB [Cyanobacteriota bacterium]